jgi:AbrB family looped-hinge helix DNA binding protein
MITTTLTSKGQVTIPKRIRDQLSLSPGAPIEFSVNTVGEVIILRRCTPQSQAAAQTDRFDAVRGRADVHWRTDDLMKLLRGDD